MLDSGTDNNVSNPLHESAGISAALTALLNMMTGISTSFNGASHLERNGNIIDIHLRDDTVVTLQLTVLETRKLD